MIKQPDTEKLFFERRSIVPLLPSINQTRSLQGFLSATANHWFQPQASEKLNGYIGRKPYYYNDKIDFYIKEPDSSRDFYQLESTMVSVDPETGETRESLFYTDLINHLRFQGGQTENPNKLFGQNSYSWCPPIDVDKFVNHTKYYWIQEPSTIEIIGSKETFLGNGVDYIFETTLPSRNYGLTKVKINDNFLNPSVDFFVYGPQENLTVELFFVPNIGDIIEIYTHSDIISDINGKKSYSFQNGLSLSNGHRVKFTNDITFDFNEKLYIVEGVGTSIFFIPDENLNSYWDVFSWDEQNWGIFFENNTPEYITIKRGGFDKNPWGTRNRWFHEEVLSSEDIIKYKNNRANRPIIEFDRNLELYNYGIFSRQDVDVIDSEYVDTFTAFASLVPWDIYGWDNYLWGGITVDDITPYDGMRILITNNDDPLVNNRIFKIQTIEVSPDIFMFLLYLENDGLDPSGSPVYGEKVYVKNGTIHGDKEYWFNGNEWVLSQIKISLNQEPLFQLYDVNKTRLQDEGIYPESNFQGNKIFGYQKNENSPIDPFIGHGLVYGEDGKIVFQDYLNVLNDNSNLEEYYSYRDGNILGYYNYRIVSRKIEDSIFSSNWWQQLYESFQLFVEEFTISNDNNIIKLSQTPDLPYFGENPYIPRRIFVYLNDVLLDQDQFSISKNEITILNIVENGDKVVVKSYSFDGPLPDSVGNWTIPSNLESNPGNIETQYISQSQLFEQFSEIIKNQKDFSGETISSNNYRDLDVNRSVGTKILQHSGSLLIPMLMSSNKDIDFMISSRYVEREYSRFKNKFIQNIQYFYTQGLLTEFDEPATWVNEILENLNVGKTLDFPFAYSGMAGELTHIPPTPSYLGFYPVYPPSKLVDDTYLPPKNVLRSHDGSIMLAFDDFRDDIILELEYRIYNSINDKFKNNSRPLFDYKKFFGGKFRKSENFEEYWNLENSKEWAPFMSYKKGETIYYSNFYFISNEDFISGINFLDDLYSYKITRLHKSTYNTEDFNKTLRSSFERWAAFLQIDYRRNDTIVVDDLWTYNFSSVKDIDGEELPGHWRGIYQYYYDTDKPHTHPWEMLGFVEKPDYWDIEYGIAPYTRGNVKLWTDLERGIIRDGSTVESNFLFARPGLSKFIPVDDWGNLLDPVNAGIVSEIPSYEFATLPWKFGDSGPVETAWRKSEYYPFAISQGSYLLKPALFSTLAWEPEKYDYKNNTSNIFLNKNDSGPQLVNLDFNSRVPYKNLKVHGEEENRQVLIKTGYQQWISSYIKSNGQDVTEKFGKLIRGLDVKLGHKFAGFIDNANMIVNADNIGLINNEDVSTALYRSPSIREEIYSGVIIEWNGRGWQIYGYDVLNPVFNTIPSDPNGRKIGIDVGKDELPTIQNWTGNTFYQVTDLVLYQNQFFRCRRTHTSSTIFETEYWVEDRNPANPPLVKISEPQDFFNEVRSVPYGTIFYSRQEVYTFLIEYGRWLESRGWLFDNIDGDTGETYNWRHVGKDYIFWSLTNWEPGTFISLSPASQLVKFETAQGMVQSVEQIVNGVYSILDREGYQIDIRNTVVSRLDYRINIQPTSNVEAGIYCCRLYVSEIEHIVLFNNKTVFNDVIYDPLLSIRQPRLYLSFIRTLGWNGRPFAPGFVLVGEDFNLQLNQTIISKNASMIPNYEKTTNDFRRFFDIENVVDSNTLREHAQHLIGYQPRDYLNNLLVSDQNVQFEFYQGMMQKKGTSKAFDAILRSNYINNERAFQYYEEWAFRIGRYGSIDIRPSLEFLLRQKESKNNVQLILFKLHVEEEIENPWDEVTWDTYNWDPSILSDDIDRLENRFDDLNTESCFLSPLSRSDDFACRIEINDIIDENGELIKSDPRWMRRPEEIENNWNLNTVVPKKMFKYRFDNDPIKGDIKTAGYVKLGEFDHAFFNMESFRESINNLDIVLEDGSRIWIYDIEGTEDWSRWKFDWTVLRVCNISKTNQIDILTKFVSDSYPIKVKVGSDHIGQPGDLVYIKGDTSTLPSIEGLHIIPENIYSIPLNSREFLIDGFINETVDFNLSDDEITDKPEAFLLKEIRLNNIEELNNLNTLISSIIPFNLGEIFWVDDGRIESEINNGVEKYWIAYKRSDLYIVTSEDPLTYNINPWREQRREDKKIDTKKIKNSILYNKRTNRIEQLLQLYDPAKGIIPGIADREIKYKLEYDPAKYTNGPFDNPNIDPDKSWGIEHVGEVWWDLSTTRYLEYEIGNKHEIDYHRYRWQNWGSLAPGITPEIYEWVRSPVPPSNWDDYVRQQETSQGTGGSYRPSGTIKDSENPSYVERIEWNYELSKSETVYYFWIKNALYIPPVEFRNTSISNISGILSNPTGYNIPWAAIPSESGVIVSGINQFLNDTDTVLQVNWDIGENEGNIHYQWILQREMDPRSDVEEILWNKMRDSLVGWDDLDNTVPDPALSEIEKYGSFIRPRQTWFKNKTKARQNFIEVANRIFSRFCLEDERLDWRSYLQVEDQKPINLEKLSLIGLGENEIIIPNYYNKNNLIVIKFDNSSYSILEEKVDYELLLDTIIGYYKIILTTPLESDETLTVNNTDYYQIVLPDISNIDLLSPEYGDHLLIENNSDADNFWTLHYWTGVEWILIKTQRYRLENDFWNFIDWYAEGFSKNDIPVRKFPNIISRNLYKNKLSNGDLVQYIDPNTGYWIRVIYNKISDSWIKVGQEKGTIEFSDKFYRNSIVYGYNSYDIDQIDQRDGSWELKIILNALKSNILTNLEKNEIFFNMVNYVHTEQSMVDWAFKTSYIYLGEYNENVDQSPITKPNIIDNIIDYIYEIKPYHVKLRDFVRRFNIFDTQSWNVTDSDKPVFYDTEQGLYRVLDPNDPADLEIIINNRPWSDWWESLNNNNISTRKIKIKLLFDRVNCNTTFGWDNYQWDQSPWSFDYNIGTENTVLRVLKGQELLNYSLNSSNDSITVFNSSLTESDITINYYYSKHSDVGDPTPLDDETLNSFTTTNKIFLVGDVWYNSVTDTFFICRDSSFNNAVWEEFNPNPYYVIGSRISSLSSTEIPIHILERAAERIVNYYEPKENMPEKNLNQLMIGCSFNETVQEGWNFNNESWGIYPWDGYPWMGEFDSYINDIVLNGGVPPILVTYNVQSWDYVGWDTFSWTTPGITYSIPGNEIPDPNNVRVFLNNILLIPNVDYTIPTFPGNEVQINVLSTIWDGMLNYGLTGYDLYSAKITILVGETFEIAPSNPYNIIVDGNKFLQPLYSNSTPEELVRFDTNEHFMLTSYTKRSQGSPEVKTNQFIGDGGREYSLLYTPQSNETVMVYKNGNLLTQNSDYFINNNSQKIEFFSDTLSTDFYQIISFGIGGICDGWGSYTWDYSSDLSTPYVWDSNDDIFYSIYYKGDGTTSTFSISEIAIDNLPTEVMVTVNGVLYDGITGVVALNGNEITLSPIPANNSSIYITVISNIKGLIIGRKSEFDYGLGIPTPYSNITTTGGTIYQLKHEVEKGFPEYSNSFVTIIDKITGESNRLNPPYTRYYNGTGSVYEFDIGFIPASYANVRVWVDGVPLIPGSDFGYTLSSYDRVAWSSLAESNAVDFSVIENKVILLEIPSNISQIVIAVYENYDFDIINGDQLYVVNAIGFDDKLEILSFTQNHPMTMRSERFIGNNNGRYNISQSPVDKDHIWVYKNGKLLAFIKDYVLKPKDYEYITDEIGYDLSKIKQKILESNIIVDEWIVDFGYPHLNTDNILIVTSSGTTSKPPVSFRMSRYEKSIDVDYKEIIVENQNGPSYIGRVPWNALDYYHVELVNPIYNDSDIKVLVNGQISTYAIHENIIGISPKPLIHDLVKIRVTNPNIGDWEYFRISDAYKTLLKSDMKFGDNSIELWIDQYLPEEQLPRYILSRPDKMSNSPGVIWINNERIQYWDIYGLEGNTDDPHLYSAGRRYIRIENIERGTKSTSFGISSENIVLFYDENSIGPDTVDGINRNFELPSSYSSNYDIWVYVDDIIQFPGVFATGYNIVNNYVVFNTAPISGSIVKIIIRTKDYSTTDIVYPANTEVIDGNIKHHLPRGFEGEKTYGWDSNEWEESVWSSDIARYTL